ncbi:MAG: hypothetical protein LC713_05195, partial [Actinobacteria bacterium]|nr:hypothetical protein [Actinomycetota bacterium]
LTLARQYGSRLPEVEWDSVLGEWEGIGPLTVAMHSGLAVGEWHIHAWDLAKAAGGDHRPADPGTVEVCRRVLRGEPSEPEMDPWLVTLIGSGRLPARPDQREGAAG